MSRTRSALLLALAMFIVAGPATGDPGADKDRIDRRIGELTAQASEQDRRAGVLTDQLSAASGKVRELDGAVSAQRARLDVLGGQLATARARVTRLDRLVRVQTDKLAVATRTYRTSVNRLERRVHDLYVADDPDLIAVVFGTESFADLLDNVELLRSIGRQDQRIVHQVAGARLEIETARARTRAARRDQLTLARRIADHVAEQQAVVVRLAASRDALAAAQADRRETLASIRGSRQDLLDEIDDLEHQSAVLAAAIRSRQSSTTAITTPPAGSGVLRWPVSGTVTSPFGTRWGRMHEGIDIAVPSGTPVGAAGSGTVIYAGWMDGYGNLVVVDHGGGLSTAYGHNSSVTVSVGQAVTAGAIIAYSGSTGHSTGPHVHFEVRVNGSPVDPLGYL